MTEELTDEERKWLASWNAKALRIIDAQAKQLAAANALLGEVERNGGVGGYPALGVRIRAHLAAQPATAPAVKKGKSYE